MFWAIGVPGLLVALVGVGLFWKQADEAVTESSHEESLALADLISTTFSLTAGDRSPEVADAPSPHRAVTEAFRSDWRMFQHVQSLRIIGADGKVRWSRRVEEEGTRLPDSARLLTEGAEVVRFDADRAEVVRSLGGSGCGGCHGENAPKVGVLQLTIDRPLLHEQVRGVFGRALLSVIILFALMLGTTWLSLHLFVNRRLARLAHVMHRAEEGDFLVRADNHGRDEIGALAEAFNKMLARITAMKADEIDTHRDLEQAQAELSLKTELERTNTTLQKRVGEQTLLFDVARSLSSTLELPELFGRISTLVGERMRIPSFSIMLVRDGRLEVMSAWPRTSGTEGVTFDHGSGACGRAAQTQIPVYVPDVETDEDVVERRPGLRHPVGSLLAVPMIHKGTVLGVINFERPGTNAFPREEIELLGAIADLAAIATKNALLHEQTVALSITDPLTGTANRRHLFARLDLEVERALRYDTPLSVVMVDIDHFKNLNDEQGHRIGDDVLRRVSELLASDTRKVDLLARYGGEEFMLVLPQADRKMALEVAEKLRRAVEEAPIPEGRMQPLGRITISIGVATLPEDARTLEHLIDCADAALYASKRGGRNLTTAFVAGMEQHPGRERGPHAARRRRTGEVPITEVPVPGPTKNSA
ncbi:MAG: diguanylate cyclase [Myxococcaceae bacterium]